MEDIPGIQHRLHGLKCVGSDRRPAIEEQAAKEGPGWILELPEPRDPQDLGQEQRVLVAAEEVHEAAVEGFSLPDAREIPPRPDTVEDMEAVPRLDDAVGFEREGKQAGPQVVVLPTLDLRLRNALPLGPAHQIDVDPEGAKP